MFRELIVSASSDKDPPKFEPSEKSAERKRSGAGARILIVEDEYLLALQAESALIEAGFHVVGIAHSADEALDLAAAEKPDLVLMDIRLAGRRDGIDTAIDLLKTRNIRCVFATAHYDSATRARAERARPAGWLNKPYSTDALVGATVAALAAVAKDEGQ